VVYESDTEYDIEDREKAESYGKGTLIDGCNRGRKASRLWRSGLESTVEAGRSWMYNTLSFTKG
jgi:hypothetical protein